MSDERMSDKRAEMLTGYAEAVSKPWLAEVAAEMNRARAREVELTARVEELEAALQRIADPIAYLEALAAAEGSRLNGCEALRISNDAGWLKEQARTALTPPTPKETE